MTSSDDRTVQEAPKPPLPSATIILARDSQQGMQIFMVKRNHQIDFASGALVFPGGKVETGDQNPLLSRYVNYVPTEISDLKFMIAAIRETFEESGILLATDLNGEKLANTHLQKLEKYRSMLENKEIEFTEFLQLENLHADTDCLVFYSHWITPEIMPKRFDTKFFIVKVPEDQIGHHDGSESVDSLWISPKQALADYEEKKRTIIFPTRMNISLLLPFQTVDEALAKFKDQKPETICPWIEERENGAFLCIPEGTDYMQSEISLEKLMKDGG